MRRTAALLALLLAISSPAGSQLTHASTLTSATRSSPGLTCPPTVHFTSARPRWHLTKLSPGVDLGETLIHDNRGEIPVHLLVADLHHPGVRVVGLHRTLARRQALTALAGNRRVVAAVNGMYFSWAYGAPVVPFIDGGRAEVLTSTPQRVAGLSGSTPESGNVWLDGAVRVGPRQARLVAVNAAWPRVGLTIYTRAWGQRRVPMWRSSRSRQIRHGRVTTTVSRRDRVPHQGVLLVASGTAARHWLHNAHRGLHASISRRVMTNASRPFSQAYGVGTQLVAQPWQQLADRYCRASAVLVARTAIGWSANGRYLELVVVGNHRGTREHGLDEDQMSQLLARFGTGQAFALDGGGSSEMVARVGAHRRLTIRNRPSDGVQRPVPVGVGVVFQRP